MRRLNEYRARSAGGTGTDPDSATSQSLLGMMDTNHNGSAGELEYLTLETAFVAAEKAPG